ncbi:SAYSVFN motif domain containing 1 [Megalopta genalis]|uniref:SAYSVFN motif domain containing 1 n=1 Tax=Megalopta genalis TaxID=115081 RepID=UPI0014434EE7|nr:SAYSvFN domain-containing protein 1 [Megalopta genalis]
MTENGIRERLDTYRRQRRRNEMTESIKNAIQTVLPWNQNSTVKDPLLSPPPEDVEDLQDAESSCSDDSLDQPQYTLLRKAMYLLCFLLWAVLYTIAIEVQFGAIYFIVSILIFIWVNTHSRPRKPGELSPYSVFNPQCKAIDGTLNAEQFEREIRYGPGSVH